MASNFTSPPALNENSVYEQWKKKIAVWQAFTDLSAEKQGPAISFHYQEKQERLCWN